MTLATAVARLRQRTGLSEFAALALMQDRARQLLATASDDTHAVSQAAQAVRELDAALDRAFARMIEYGREFDSRPRRRNQP